MGTVDPIAGGGAKADKLAPGDQPKADTLHPDEFTRGSEVSTRASVNQLNSNAFNIGFFKSDPTWKPVGVTGSSRVTGEDGAKYQLKKSISHIGEFFSGFLRRFKAWWSNRENMGEFISSTVSRFIDPKKAPEVSIVTNPEQNQVFIASKYFPEAYNLGGSEEVITPNNINRSRICRAIALSALSCDHDINPSNFMVDPNTGDVARIDFGHAFNDLLHWRSWGGRPVSSNAIIDYFNREDVNGFGADGKSKLWRHFTGVVPSQEMVDALKELSNESSLRKTQEGLELAKRNLLSIPEEESPGIFQKTTREKIRKSLLAIHKTLHDSSIDSNKTYEEFLGEFFQGLNQFYAKNLQDMKKAASVMKFQLRVERALHSESDITALREEFNRRQRGKKQSITWIKRNAEEPAFRGGFDAYVAHRRKRMSAETSSRT